MGVVLIQVVFRIFTAHLSNPSLETQILGYFGAGGAVHYSGKNKGTLYP